MKLKDQVAIITGSSRGIGRAAALLFAQEGADIVVNYVRDADAAQKVVDKIKEMGRRAIAVQADIGNLKDHEKLVKATLDEFGRIDILYHNAAIHYICKTIDDVTEEVWDQTYNIIVKGPFFLTKHVVPHMLKQGRGSILFTLTAGIYNVRPSDWHYLSAKAATAMLVRTLAGTLAPQIRVNAVIPGTVMTDMFRHHPPETWEALAKMTPMGRMATPMDVAKVALWLVSPDAEYITGCCIPVDGGSIACASKETMKQILDRLLPGLALYNSKMYERWLKEITSGLEGF
ncbi:MAG: glucose 1-dehydrogenase [Candidatus Bathyarchaeia archaeon]